MDDFDFIIDRFRKFGEIHNFYANGQVKLTCTRYKNVNYCCNSMPIGINHVFKQQHFIWQVHVVYRKEYYGLILILLKYSPSKVAK